MKILGTLTKEIHGLLEKEKDIEHEIADWNNFEKTSERVSKRLKII